MSNPEDIQTRRSRLSPMKRALLERSSRGERVNVTQKPAILPREVQGPVLQSFAQQRLWFMDQLEPSTSYYNMSMAIRLQGTLDVGVLERSLQEIVRRHEILRTTFADMDGKSVQIIAPTLSLPLNIIDLCALPERKREAEILQLATAEALRPFNLVKGALLRTTLLRASKNEYVLLLTTHHIVSDGWSEGILIQELATLYTAYLKGQPAHLPDLSIQYADYALWQRQWLQGEVLTEHLAYWSQQLGKGNALPVVHLPTDFPRPAIQTFHGALLSLHLPLRLRDALNVLSQREGCTLFMTLLSAFQVLLSYLSGQDNIVVGTPVANRALAELEPLIGFFLNMLVLRTDLSGSPGFRQLMKRVRQVCLGAYAHQALPFEQVVEALQPKRDLSQNPLFQIMFVLQNMPGADVELPDLSLNLIPLERNTTRFDLTMEVVNTEQGLSTYLEYNTDLFTADTVTRMLGHWQTLLEALVANPDQQIDKISLLTSKECQQLLVDWNATHREYLPVGIHALFERQVEHTPEHVAVIFEDQQVTYADLNARSNQLAHYLRSQGVGPDVLVGICVERSPEMLIGLLGILKAGGAYLPLDRTYPQERLIFMVQDAQIKVLVTTQALAATFSAHSASVVCLDRDHQIIEKYSVENLQTRVQGENLAYVIYTSGSTGKPKGVMVQQRNIANFFTAMNNSLGTHRPGKWLALTSISFDISVLELFWPLTQGFQVIIQSDVKMLPAQQKKRQKDLTKELEFSLFYFANSDYTSDSTNKYRLLIEGARFADQHGFSAIWTPERHFNAFGGLYPNPSVTSAAIAAVTERLSIRAGSVVLPLHNPVRIAEEWSVVDNLSQGRVGLSFASGWHANDFVLAPDLYSTRKEFMLHEIDTVRKLWRGEAITLRGGAGNDVDVKVFPRPLQAELPIWLTASGNPETFRLAGEMGANVLTHLLGQDIEELAQKIVLYRSSWEANGHKSGKGHVTLMLHAFVGKDSAATREKVRQPFCNYLKSSFGLLQALGHSLGYDLDSENFTAEDMEALLDHAFNRYYKTSGLMGTLDDCLAMARQLREIGVDEVACLIDFGIATDDVLASLHELDQVRKLVNGGEDTDTGEDADTLEGYTIAEQIKRHGISHLQCTPSLMNILSMDVETHDALNTLEKLLLGGEALPISLAMQLGETIKGDVCNMYGPTETTIWSTMSMVDTNSNSVSIGRPIANTQVYILDKNLLPLPIGVPGELYIGGDGVVRGYLARPDLTAQKFIPDPFTTSPGARLYRTGDLASYLPDGNIAFLGRIDRQVKVHGFRIEPGEIEAVLLHHSALQQCVVVAQEDETRNRHLVAYVVAREVPPSVQELRSFLLETLPDHMVPSIFVWLETVPLTPNGKVDYQALPDPEIEQPEVQPAFVAPRTPVEQTLVDIWTHFLPAGRIGVHDNFFELGGDSIISLQIVFQAKQLGLNVTLKQIFQYQTIAQLARLLKLTPTGVVSDQALQTTDNILANFPKAKITQADLDKIRTKIKRNERTITNEHGKP